MKAGFVVDDEGRDFGVVMGSDGRDIEEKRAERSERSDLPYPPAAGGGDTGSLEGAEGMSRVGESASLVVVSDRSV